MGAFCLFKSVLEDEKKRFLRAFGARGPLVVRRSGRIRLRLSPLPLRRVITDRTSRKAGQRAGVLALQGGFFAPLKKSAGALQSPRSKPFQPSRRGCATQTEEVRR